MRAWVFQDSRQKKKHGTKAPWSVGWIDPDGKRRSKRIGSKSRAEKYSRKMEGQLAAGTYENVCRVSWSSFVGEYDCRVLSSLKPASRVEVLTSLRHFNRIVNPVHVDGVRTAMIDDYIARRKVERGRKPGSVVSPYTIKKELSSIRAALNVALDWEYLAKVPKFRRVKVPDADPRPVTREHFQAIYSACDVATMPAGLPYAPVHWWQAILMFAMTTGWRKNEILSLDRSELDLESGRIKTLASINKGSRDDVDFLPEATLDHLRQIKSFHSAVFPWPHGEKSFDAQYHRIQRAAGIHLDCIIQQRHECTTCHVYVLHDLRRAYATENVDRLPIATLQKKMRHRNIRTTMRYVDMASKMKKATDEIYVPEVRRDGTGS